MAKHLTRRTAIGAMGSLAASPAARAFAHTGGRHHARHPRCAFFRHQAAAGIQGAPAVRRIRDVPGVKKKPSTPELLDWLKLLMVEDISAETLRERDPKRLIPPPHGALLKNEQGVHLFERLAFMARREGR